MSARHALLLFLIYIIYPEDGIVKPSFDHFLCTIEIISIEKLYTFLYYALKYQGRLHFCSLFCFYNFNVIFFTAVYGLIVLFRISFSIIFISSFRPGRAYNSCLN
jgi:hypothetical protein